MWQNIIILLIIVACMFFIGRRIRSQLGGSKTGCGCSCSGCDDKSAKTENCETKTTRTLH